MGLKNIKKLQNGSDVRGIVLDGVSGEKVNLTEEIVKIIAFSFSRWLKKKLKKENVTFAVGRDSRLSGAQLEQAVTDGFRGEGHKIYRCGLATTPAMFMTTVDPIINADGAVMVTASHLPFNRNGLKFFTRDGGLNKEAIAEILEMAERTASFNEEGGTVIHTDFLPAYAKGILKMIRRKTGEDTPLAGTHIVVDAGNGAGGFFVDQILSPLGAKTKGSQYLEPDGNFPNHVPNPEDAVAIEHISCAVRHYRADMGIIFDTDVDRAAIIDENGKAINRNGFIAFMARILLAEYPGTTIVTDSITSTGLTQYIQALGGKHHRFKRGYKNVINEAIRLNKEGNETHLAMETSGHGAVKENYFLDDGAYMVTMALIQFTKLHRSGVPLSSFLKDLKEPVEAKEIRFDIMAEDDKVYGEEVLRGLACFAKEQTGWTLADPNYEGVRVNCDADSGNGWYLLRMSLHDPVMSLNIESDSPGGCTLIEKRLRKYLSECKGLK